MPEIDYLCSSCWHRLATRNTCFSTRPWVVFCENCLSDTKDHSPNFGWGDTIEDALDAYRDSRELHDRPGPVSINDLEEVQAEGEAILREL